MLVLLRGLLSSLFDQVCIAARYSNVLQLRWVLLNRVFNTVWMLILRQFDSAGTRVALRSASSIGD